MNRKFKRGDLVKVKCTLDNVPAIFSHYTFDDNCSIITEIGILIIHQDDLYLNRTEIINQLLDE